MSFYAFTVEKKTRTLQFIILCIFFRYLGQSLESELIEAIMKEMSEPKIKSSDELLANSHQANSDTEPDSQETDPETKSESPQT